MSYDLAVWDGERPESDAAATATFLEFMDAMEAGYDEPPLPSVVEFVDVLTGRWPETGDAPEDQVDDTPWAAGPILAEAVGPLVYFAVVPGRAVEVADFAAMATRSQGLVCYDPQTERLL